MNKVWLLWVHLPFVGEGSIVDVYETEEVALQAKEACIKRWNRREGDLPTYEVEEMTVVTSEMLERNERILNKGN